VVVAAVVEEESGEAGGVFVSGPVGVCTVKDDIDADFSFLTVVNRGFGVRGFKLYEHGATGASNKNTTTKTMSLLKLTQHVNVNENMHH